MKLVIVGPGAIGCLLGSIFSGSGHDVTLLDKDEARAQAITQSGVIVDHPSGSETMPIRTTAQPDCVSGASFVCICVKSFDTGEAVGEILPFLDKETAVVSFQNGLGNVELIAQQVQPDRIVCAVTGHGATSLGVGHIVHAGTGRTSVAPYKPEHPDHAGLLASALVDAGLETECVDDKDRMLWSKLVVNAAINPVSALADVANGTLLKDPKLQHLSLAAAREAEEVALAKGIALVYEDAAREVERVCTRTADNISSMLQDIRRGKRTEVDVINGAIVREAQALGMNVPVNEKLLQDIKRLESQA